MLEVSNLSINVFHKKKWYSSVSNVSLTVNKGDIVGIIGESGSGKTLTAKAISNLLPANVTADGEILFNGENLSKASGKQWQNIYGNKISYIFQNPMTALNPVMKIGVQVMDAYLAHHPKEKKQAKKIALETLEMAGIKEAERIFLSYPHELSGGLKQRVIIAIAIVNRPDLVIADEPTTALDAAVRKQILDLFINLRDQLGLSILLISHDISAIQYICDKIIVLYGGKLLEKGDCSVVLKAPAHPYTQALLQSIPRMTGPREIKGIPGAVPSLSETFKGCNFAPRCPFKHELCTSEQPLLRVSGDPHREVACHRPITALAEARKQAMEV
ncbi:peptide ABC transporter ATP-binding protein [Bacillus sp. V3-13]|uniref:ABC transporter ATP-binding protein n=1 Tax=Bacillus sp. V3-13 TaxID=2053728 RepID=UPI000C783540|nr:ABC transporter ATP-binding protein [Bacillus sp. V3-13]PLR75755.1 peptide ABC transporter ATP-binding protein [Bacillus sp. V3-13]